MIYLNHGATFISDDLVITVRIINITVRIINIILIMVRIPPGGRQGPAQHPRGWRRVGPLKYCTLSNSDENSEEGWDDDALWRWMLRSWEVKS